MAALNAQTAVQFQQYAAQQYPNSPEQQVGLIRQLQEQHYQQYMQQLYQVQLAQQQVCYMTTDVQSHFLFQNTTFDKFFPFSLSFGFRLLCRSSSSRLIWLDMARWNQAVLTAGTPSLLRLQDSCVQLRPLLERRFPPSMEASQTRTRRAWTGSRNRSLQRRSQRTGHY